MFTAETHDSNSYENIWIKLTNLENVCDYVTPVQVCAISICTTSQILSETAPGDAFV